MNAILHRWKDGEWLCLQCGHRSPDPCDCDCHEQETLGGRCYIHNRIEPQMEGDFRTCGECNHIFRTAEELIEDDYNVRVEGLAFWRSDKAIQSPEALAMWAAEPEPERRKPEDIWVCPLCTHDF